MRWTALERGGGEEEQNTAASSIGATALTDPELEEELL